MKIIARLLVATLALAASIVGIAVTSPAAHAADPTLKLCVDDNYKGYCLYRVSYDTNFKNDCFRWYDGSHNWGKRDCGFGWPSFNDKASSVDNNTKYWWKLFEDTKYGGFVLCLRPWGYDGNLGNNTDYEDDISSVKRYSTSRPGGCDQVIG